MTDYFERLQGELRSAAVRQDAGQRSDSRERPARRMRRSRGLLALAVAVIVAVPAAAAVVVFEPQRERDGLTRTAPKALLASGEDPEFGKWHAFASNSTVGSCFGLRLIDPPGFEPGSTSEGCGATRPTARIGGGDGPRRTALFGFVPKAARRVRIQANGHPGRTFPTHPTTDPRGAFFFASLPENPSKLPGLRIVVLHAHGHPITTSR